MAQISTKSQRWSIGTTARFDKREQTALAYAEAMTRTDQQVDDGAYGQLRKHFDDDGIIELTALIAFQNMSSKFNSALAVPPQGFCQLPTRTADRASVRDEHAVDDLDHLSDSKRA